jgi:hypothetical protein
VIVTGTTGTNLRVLTLSDALTPELEPGLARIRVVNARAATNMNVTVAPWNATTQPSPQTLTAPSNITGTATASTGWIPVPAGEPVVITMTTTAGGAIDSINWVPVEGQEVILVATDPASGPAPLRWIFTSACGRP